MATIIKRGARNATRFYVFLTWYEATLEHERDDEASGDGDAMTDSM